MQQDKLADPYAQRQFGKGLRVSSHAAGET